MSKVGAEKRSVWAPSLTDMPRSALSSTPHKLGMARSLAAIGPSLSCGFTAHRRSSRPIKTKPRCRHSANRRLYASSWMAGTSPAMTAG